MEPKDPTAKVTRRALLAGTAASGLAAAASPALGESADPQRLQPRFRRRHLDK